MQGCLLPRPHPSSLSVVEQLSHKPVSLTDARLEAALWFGVVQVASSSVRARTSPVLQDSRPRCRIAAVVSGRIALPVRKGRAATCAGIPGAGKPVLSAAPGFSGTPAMWWRIQRRRRATRRAFRKKPPTSPDERFHFRVHQRNRDVVCCTHRAWRASHALLLEKSKLLYRSTWVFLSPKEDFDFPA